MKLFGTILCAALLSFAFVHDNALHIGDHAPMSDVEMKNIDGNMTSLDALAKKNGLLVVFSCNTCPFVVGNGTKSEGWEGRYDEYQKLAMRTEMGMVLINSNEAKRDAGDSMDDMIAHAQTNGYDMPYVIDEDHRLADAFGAKTTPHVYLFDKDMKLAYSGAIDDNVNSASGVQKHYLRDAMMAVFNGKDVPVKETKPVGCSIKRVKK